MFISNIGGFNTPPIQGVNTVAQNFPAIGETKFQDIPLTQQAVPNANRIDAMIMEFRHREALFKYTEEKAYKEAMDDAIKVFDGKPDEENKDELDGSRSKLRADIAAAEKEIEMIGKEIERLTQQKDSSDVAAQISYLQLQARIISAKRDGYARTLGEIYPPIDSSFGSGNQDYDDTIGEIKNRLKSAQADRVEEDIQKEMIKLIQYKNHYEAVMKLIEAKDEMVSSLIAIV